MLPVLGFPGALRTPESRDWNEVGLWVKVLSPRFAEEAAALGSDRIAFPGLDRASFAQVLAKTAHSFAVAELGIHTFRPLLTPLIREPPRMREELPLFIGGWPDEPPGDALHEIGWTLMQANGRTYVVVSWHMFANIGGPRYVVVAGERA